MSKIWRTFDKDWNPMRVHYDNAPMVKGGQFMTVEDRDKLAGRELFFSYKDCWVNYGEVPWEQHVLAWPNPWLDAPKLTLTATFPWAQGGHLHDDNYRFTHGEATVSFTKGGTLPTRVEWVDEKYRRFVKCDLTIKELLHEIYSERRHKQ